MFVVDIRSRFLFQENEADILACSTFVRIKDFKDLPITSVVMALSQTGKYLTIVRIKIKLQLVSHIFS